MSGNPIVHSGRLCIRLAFRVPGFELSRRRVFTLGVGLGTQFESFTDLWNLSLVIEFDALRRRQLLMLTIV